MQWGTLSDQEKFIQACEFANFDVLLQLIESNDSNLIEGDLSFFQAYAVRFEDKKRKSRELAARASKQKNRYPDSPGNQSIPNSLDFDSYLQKQGVAD